MNQRKNMAYIVELRNVDIWKIWKEEGQMEIISRRGDMKFYQRCGLDSWNRAQHRRKLCLGGANAHPIFLLPKNILGY
jgi:hypothetical protein